MGCDASLPKHHGEEWRLLDRMSKQGPCLSHLLCVAQQWIDPEL